MQINVIGVPTHLGCDRNGPQLAPSVLREHGLIDIVKRHGHDVHDLGDVSVPSREELKKYQDHPKVKYLNGVVDVANQLYDLVYRSYQQHTFPLIVGGDHSLSLGSGAAAAHFFDHLGMIWFDAHGDFNMEPASPSGNAHGMPCAALMGLSVTDLEQVVKRRIDPKHIFWVGTRDLDVGEDSLIKTAGLSVYTAQEVKEKGMDWVVKDINKKMKERGLEHIHFSLDIDGMDPQYTPGTGTAVPDGVNMEDFKTLIKGMFATKQICSLDFVEFNPLLDMTDETLNWCLEALDYIVAQLEN